MEKFLSASLLAGSLLVGMLLFLEIGRRCGLRRLAKDPEAALVGIGAVEGAVYGLLSLLIAFSFNGASSRFDARRQLIVAEASAISDAYARLDLLPAEAQPALRDNFRQYVEARLAVHQKLVDLEATTVAFTRSIKLQGAIWTQAVDAVRRAGPSVLHPLVLVSLNEMTTLATTRTAAAKSHPPLAIFLMLFGVALASALLAGFSMAANKAHSRVFMVAFAAVVAVAVFITLELEFPRIGLIRIDSLDQIFVELRESMNPR